MSNHGSMSVSKVLFSPSSRFIRFATSRSISRLCFELTRVVFRTLASGESSALENFHFISFTSPPPFRTSAQYSIIVGFSPKFQEGQIHQKGSWIACKTIKKWKIHHFGWFSSSCILLFPFRIFFFENNRKMALLVSSHLGRLNS